MNSMLNRKYNRSILCRRIQSLFFNSNTSFSTLQSNNIPNSNSSIYNIEKKQMDLLFNNSLDAPSAMDMDVIVNRQIESPAFDVVGS